MHMYENKTLKLIDNNFVFVLQICRCLKIGGQFHLEIVRVNNSK